MKIQFERTEKTRIPSEYMGIKTTESYNPGRHRFEIYPNSESISDDLKTRELERFVAELSRRGYSIEKPSPQIVVASSPGFCIDLETTIDSTDIEADACSRTTRVKRKFPLSFLSKDRIVPVVAYPEMTIKYEGEIDYICNETKETVDTRKVEDVLRSLGYKFAVKQTGVRIIGTNSSVPNQDNTGNIEPRNSDREQATYESSNGEASSTYPDLRIVRGLAENRLMGTITPGLRGETIDGTVGSISEDIDGD
jgi:hypothetical protein